MFLRPQHFQQHDRYIENLVNGRCLGLQPYSWGFYSMTLDADLFKIGKPRMGDSHYGFFNKPR